MSLSRFFTILSSIVLAALVSTSGALYQAARQQAFEAGRQTVRLAAESTARSVGNLIALLNQSLTGLAQDPRLADIASGDAASLKKEENRLTQLIPGALQVRILGESVDTLDESRTPRMGFADLDMVRKAVNAPPPPAVHGANTPDIHLALARRLEQGHGVILASLSLKVLENAVAAAVPGSGALELRQDAIALGYSGDPNLKTEVPAGEVAIPATPWKIAYWTPAEVDARGWWFFLVPVVAGTLLAVCVFLLYRWLERALRHDMESIASLVKDLLRGKLQGHYPVKIAEGQSLVRQLSQAKPLEQPTPHRKEVPEEEPKKFVAPELTRLKEHVTMEVTPQAHNVSPAIFRAYDIRGVVGETLTAEVVYEIGRAIGSEAHARGEQRVIIARDGRLSSPELGQALARGLQETGRTVVDIGLAPTPLLYFATHVLNSKSGVMLTGSHNPANYNGLKIVIGGETLAETDIQQLRLRIENHDFVKGAGKIETRDLIPDYIERIVEDTQIGRPMKIVMDCGNGVAGKVAPALMKSLDCEVVELYCDVDGNFPNHHPDPSKLENLQDLIKTVLSEKADLGVAFDGDGDRLGVVDSSGKIIWPDRQMMLFAADVLSRQPGADIIYDVKCTRHLAGQIVKNGGRPLMWKTGHSLIKAKIRETGAMLAGEMSGHIFFKERWYGFDDGIYACARLIEILSGDPRSTAEVFAELPDSLNTPELNVSLAEGENFTFIEQLRALAQFPEARITDIDGLRVDFVDGWGLVRASNTTPSLVIRFEADNEQALARIQGQFRELMLQVKPDIALPF
jgi:phosphomannomutase/phosphoglucomutase